MKFVNDIVMFDFAGTKILGNLTNGYSIGLTKEGAQLCERLFSEDIPGADISAVDEGLATHLIRGEYFFKPEKASIVDSAYLHVTQRCDMDCVGCYSYDDNRNSYLDPSLDDLLKCVSELVKAGLNTLTISGGEPFLREDLPEIVVRAKKEYGVKHITVATNGASVTQYVLGKMADSVDRISVSFDGYSNSAPSYIRGSQRFSTLMNAVNMIRDAGIKAQITPTLHAKNIDDMDKYAELAVDDDVIVNYSLLTTSPHDAALQGLLPADSDLVKLGQKVFCQSCLTNTAVEGAPVSVGLSVRKMCGAGAKALSIAYDGTVYPCHMLHSEGLQMGNLFTEPIQRILDRNPLPIPQTGEDGVIPECSDCNYRWLCGAGCKARAFLFTNDFKNRDPYCELYKEYYRLYDHHLAERLSGKV